MLDLERRREEVDTALADLAAKSQNRGVAAQWVSAGIAVVGLVVGALVVFTAAALIPQRIEIDYTNLPTPITIATPVPTLAPSEDAVD